MQRKFINASIDTLRAVYEEATSPISLKELDHELSFRRTKAAVKLRGQIQEAMKRTYLNASIQTLQAEVENTNNPSVLNAILYELSFRRTRAAEKLRSTITDLMQSQVSSSSSTRTNSTQLNTPTASAQNSKKPSNKKPDFIKPSYKLTHEQEEAVDAFMTGESVKVIAYAGTGKTSTLSSMASMRSDNGIYLAFNRSIADEAKNSFPRNVDCRTTHSLAFRAVMSQNSQYTTDKLFTFLRPKILLKKLADEEDYKDQGGIKVGDFNLSPVDLAFLSQKTITYFCQSADTHISINHVKKIGKLRQADKETFKKLAGYIQKEAEYIWSKMVDPRSEIPLGHDGYLKLWSLSNPSLGKNFNLLDEAQDTNPCVSHVMSIQNSQNVIVGDSQQQIYAWRGAEDAMQTLPASKVCYLSQSFRFGDAIAVEADKILKALGESKSIRGNPNVQSKVIPYGDANAILARSNAMVITELMSALDSGKTPHIVGGVKELLQMVGDVYELKKSLPPSHPDFFGFSSWQEVLEYASSEEGESLAMFVNLVTKFGEHNLYSALKRVVNEESDASVILSTAHKAKGRQWSSVKIAEDFEVSNSEAGISKEEMRLFYVSITRAKHTLIIDPNILNTYRTAKVTSESKIKSKRPSASKIYTEQSYSTSKVPETTTKKPNQIQDSNPVRYEPKPILPSSYTNQTPPISTTPQESQYPRTNKVKKVPKANQPKKKETVRTQPTKAPMSEIRPKRNTLPRENQTLAADKSDAPITELSSQKPFSTTAPGATAQDKVEKGLVKKVFGWLGF